MSNNRRATCPGTGKPPRRIENDRGVVVGHCSICHATTRLTPKGNLYAHCA